MKTRNNIKKEYNKPTCELLLHNCENTLLSASYIEIPKAGDDEEFDGEFSAKQTDWGVLDWNNDDWGKVDFNY